MASIHNMIHADIQGAEARTNGAVALYLSGNHTLTIFPDTEGKSHHEIARAINEAVARHDAANAEPVSPPQN